MSQITFGCQFYTWQMSGERYVGKLPHILDVVSTASFAGIEPETCMLGTYYDDPAAVQDVLDDAPSVDDEWFHYYIRVEDNHVIIQIDGKTTMAWTQPEDWTPPEGMEGRMISEGTIALQGHDPDSIVYYKNIMVRVPPSPMD